MKNNSIIQSKIASLYPWLMNNSLRLCKDLMDAEDLAGDTILKALSNIKRYDGRKALKPWLKAILMNTFITGFNRKKVVSFCCLDDVIINTQAETTTIVYLNDIKDALERCRKKTCAVDCMLAYSKGFNYQEIANLYGLKIGTVRSRINTGRKLMKQELS